MSQLKPDADAIGGPHAEGLLSGASLDFLVHLILPKQCWLCLLPACVTAPPGIQLHYKITYCIRKAGASYLPIENVNTVTLRM